ncbi:hypothetical protein IFM89_020171 [Coptis chinensis]|uniref:mannan endo-1,4-beta-mannosidase n=1 Tax=Coptis chinensis TaxID=261450 RepID=A0A835LHX2_9MAGN|nr:hypothetical protein IFM89_020171 [Coptis chinensis]
MNMGFLSPNPFSDASYISKMMVFFFFTLFVLHQENVVHLGEAQAVSGSNFIKTSGKVFMRNGRPVYFNGFNAYWLMTQASNPSHRGNVTSVFQEAMKNGMTVSRTWAFSDGGQFPLQISPGVYNQDMLKGLDFVISEAAKYRIYLILSLVNNYPDFGGRNQYVQWAKERGQQLKSTDDFYTCPTTKGYYKNHIKTILERKNSITGVAYKDDPIIFAWELMNEPRCETDLSGKILQDWIKEMATYVKSIDSNHLLEIGLEGFYGESKKEQNPNGYMFGTDFVSNNLIAEIDFTTIHAYPDAWFPGSDDQTQLKFVQKWLQVHIEDSNEILKKPLLFTEFGKSSNISGYNIMRRDTYYDTVYNDIYTSAKSGGACKGALFWQALNQGMNDLCDGYEVILVECNSTAKIIAQQSQKLSDLSRG